MDKTENFRFSNKGRLKTVMPPFCLLSDDLPIVQTKIRLGLTMVVLRSNSK
jgi:hypothetical protein